MPARAAALALLVAFLPAAPAQEKKKTNRLAKESSPYLLQHAHNPVDWHPWDEEAFAKARKEGKLVFLSIGYSSCHWCHVMEKESFAHEDVAKILNQHFVCVKVDREERPDVDQIYMTALHALGQRGGWPLSMFLTADARPIFGGTYWPREDRTIEGEKVRGFKSILNVVREIREKDPAGLDKQATEVARMTRLALTGAAIGTPLVELNRELVAAAVDGLKEEFDPKHGGFGSPARGFRGTKFPTPPYLSLIQREAERTKAGDLDRILTVTLDNMARGGIYDQLGGGFHRYSTERTWTVPHFEKMLYDNAQLVEVYARQHRRDKNPLYARVVRETLAFVGRELTSPDGAFYAALDADSEGEEGVFYVWTGRNLDLALKDKGAAEVVKKVYGVAGKPNFEEKAFVLTRAAEPAAGEEAALAAASRKLFEARAKRPRPFLDTKVLTAWNGQMIAGYAVAGRELNEPAYVRAAARAADFVLAKLRAKDGRLLRTYGARPGDAAEARLNAYLDDYAYLVHGLLALHDATDEKRWLDEAKALTDTMVKLFGDESAGGFYYTSSDHEKLFARAKDQHDGAQPSGNSTAARNLVRLGRKTGEERYLALAERTIRGLSAALKTSPTSLTGLAEALALYLDARGAAPKK